MTSRQIIDLASWNLEKNQPMKCKKNWFDFTVPDLDEFDSDLKMIIAEFD